MFKNKLQEVAQKHYISLPEYKSIKDGPDHAPRFKATVTYNGRTFESPAFCKTAKEAQNAAAEFALEQLFGKAGQRPKQTNGPLPVQTQLGVTSLNSNIEEKKEHNEDGIPDALANCEKNDGTLQQLHDRPSSSQSGTGNVLANNLKKEETLQQQQDRSYPSVPSMVRVLENNKKTEKILQKPQDEPQPPKSFPISRVQNIVPSRGISISETSRNNNSSGSEISQNGIGKEQGHDIAVSVLERRQWNEETSKQQFVPSPLPPDMHKNQLQDLALRGGGFSLPSYSSIRKGPSHVPVFKASVTFNGETFESPEFYGTLRQAEHAAAAVALKSLTEKGFSLDESAMYKNFLQEYAQKEGIPFPEYVTTRSGLPHMPIFKSTVKFSGKVFAGKEANSKKQAEKNAAMAAWSVLKGDPGRSSSVSMKKTSDNGEKESDHEANVNIQQSPGQSISHLSKSLSAVSLRDGPDSEDTDTGTKKELEQQMTPTTLTYKDKDTVQQPQSRPLHEQLPSGTTIRVVPQASNGAVGGTGPSSRSNTWVTVNLTDNAMQSKHNSTS